MSGVYWGQEQLNPVITRTFITPKETIAYYRNATLKPNQTYGIQLHKPRAYVGTRLRVKDTHVDDNAHGVDRITSVLPTSDMNQRQSLHAILKVLMESIRRKIDLLYGPLKNDKLELFTAPRQKALGKYYTPAIELEHRDYFVRQRKDAELRDNRGRQQTYLRRLHVTKVDDQRYAFDRESRNPLEFRKKIKHTNDVVVAGFEPNQHAWSVLHGKKLVAYRKRFEHLLAICEEQQAKEIQREIQLCAVMGKGEDPTIRATCEEERAEAADWIMRILEEYDFISEVENGEYLKGTLASMTQRRGATAEAPVKDRRKSTKTIVSSRLNGRTSNTFQRKSTKPAKPISSKTKPVSTKLNRTSNIPQYIETTSKSYAAQESLWTIQQKANLGHIRTAKRSLLYQMSDPKTGIQNRSFSSVLHTPLAYYQAG